MRRLSCSICDNRLWASRFLFLAAKLAGWRKSNGRWLCPICVQANRGWEDFGGL